MKSLTILPMLAAVLLLPVSELCAQGRLGVSRVQILTKLAEVAPDMTLDYEESPLIGGERRLMGTSTFVTLELIGPPGNLRQITMMFVPQQTGIDNLSALAVAATFLGTVFPAWAESLTWFGDALASSVEESTTTRNGIEVRMNNYVQVMGMILLTLEAQ